MSDASRHVADGLFEIVEGGPRLIGSRCTGCGTLYFPQAPGCRNPDCDVMTIERMHLPDRGTIVSFTVQRYRPPPLFRMDDWVPYAIALIDLGEGVEVMGMLSGVQLDAIRIGAAVKLVSESLFTDEDGRAVLTFKFAPVAAL